MIKQENDLDDILVLIRLNPDRLAKMDRSYLAHLITVLGEELVRYKDRMCSTKEVAKMFDRSVDWVYSATSRPNTSLQRKISEAAVRDGRIVSFPASELLRIKQELKSNCDE